LHWLARGLSAVAARLEAKDAAAATGEAAATLAQAIKDTKDPRALRPLTQGLSAVAARLEAKDAAEAATTLVRAIKDAKDPLALDSLAGGLSAVAARLEAKDAAAATGEAAATLAQAIKDTKDPNALQQPAESLSKVGAYMEPKDAADAAATLVRAIKDAKDPRALSALAWGLSVVAARLEAKDAAEAAATLVQLMKDSAALHSPALGLSALLSAVAPTEIPSRTVSAASAVAFPAGEPLTALAFVLRAAEPPCRLSTQQLVELLKMPTCIHQARHVILVQLGNRYRRHFADVWEFVRFAQEQDLGLDFTSPPKRPPEGMTVATKP
jgi:hypothetical protein